MQAITQFKMGTVDQCSVHLEFALNAVVRVKRKLSPESTCNASLTHLHLEHCQGPHSQVSPSQEELSHSRSRPHPSQQQSRQTHWSAAHRPRQGWWLQGGCRRLRGGASHLPGWQRQQLSAPQDCKDNDNCDFFFEQETPTFVLPPWLG